MALKAALIIAAAAVTLAASFAPPVRTASAAQPAQFVRCIAQALSVTAIGHGILGVDKRVTRVAIADWQNAISQRVGTNYGDWSHSLGARVECHRELFKVTCVATATPCRS